MPKEDLAEDFCSYLAIEAPRRPPLVDKMKNCGAKVTARIAIHH